MRTDISQRTNEPLRIAMFVGQFPALSETFILDQLTGLVEGGHQVDIFADRRSREPRAHAAVTTYGLEERTRVTPRLSHRRLRRWGGAGWLAIRHGVRHPRKVLQSLDPLRYGSDATSFRLLRWASVLLDEPDYDVIHCHFGPNGRMAVLLRAAGIVQAPIITTFHGYDVNRHPRRHGKEIYQRLFAQGDRFTANSEFTCRRAIALGCPEEKIEKLPVGVDLSAIEYREKAPDAGKPIRILSVARLAEEKGLEFSLKAVAHVMRRYANLEYHIVGEGERRSKLEAIIAELSVGDRIRLVGAMTSDRLRECYAASHLFILPSIRTAAGDEEGQGLVLQEAQAAGLPVIASRIGGVAEGIEEGRSGFLVPEKDVAAIEKCLNNLLEHPHRWAEMGRRGRAWVEAHYDRDRLNDRLVDIYRETIVRCGRPGSGERGLS